MEFFLTDKDTDIEKNIQKDPLCQESIWRYYAGKLYENINSVTNDIKGFIITVNDDIESNDNVPSVKDEINILNEISESERK